MLGYGARYLSKRGVEDEISLAYSLSHPAGPHPVDRIQNVRKTVTIPCTAASGSDKGCASELVPTGEAVASLDHTSVVRCTTAVESVIMTGSGPAECVARQWTETGGEADVCESLRGVEGTSRTGGTEVLAFQISRQQITLMSRAAGILSITLLSAFLHSLSLQLNDGALLTCFATRHYRKP